MVEIEPLFGREDELGGLRAAFGEIAGEPTQTRLVVVTGVSGIGKTSLCGVAAAEFEAAGALVLGGACPRPWGAPMAYAPFVAAWAPDAQNADGGEGFGGWLAQLSRLDDDAPEVAQAWLCERVLGRLHDWGRRRPVVLMLEDAHWIDPASMGLLQAIATARGRGRLLVVVTARTDGPQTEAVPALLELAMRPGARLLELGPLRDEAVREIACELDDEAAAQVVRRAAGHPLFAVELLRHRGSGLPGTLQALLEQRMRALGPDGVHLLAAATLAGDLSNESTLAEMLNLPTVSGLIDAAIRQGLLCHANSGRVRPRHPLFGEAAITALAQAVPDEKKRWHTWLAERTEASTAAWHWEQAGEPDHTAQCWHEGGLAATARHAHAEAAHAYRRALELRETPHLHLALAQALRWSGRPKEAAAVLRRALALAPPDDLPHRCEILCQLWDCRFLAGSRDEAYETLREATALARGLPDSPLTARLAAAEASALMTQGRYAEGAARSLVALRHAERVSDLATQARALSTRGVCLAFSDDAGDIDEAIETLDAARNLAHRLGSVRELTRAAGNLTYVLVNTGRPERAVTIGREALSRLDTLGLAGALGGPLTFNIAVSLLALGRWDELCELNRRVDDRLPPGKAARMRLCLAEVSALRGDHAETARLLAEADEIIDGPDALYEAEKAIPLALSKRTAGQPRAAIEVCRSALRKTAELGPIERLRLCAEALGALHELQTARGRITRIDHPEEVISEFQPTIRPSTSEERALVLLCDAETTRDPKLWKETAEAWDDLKMVYHAAYARMRHAESLIAARDPAAAGSPLRQAFSTAVELGTRPLREDTERVARQGRIPLLSRQPDAPERPHMAVLTRREREVLELVGCGRTNREIAGVLVLSERTVGVHVSRILAKLGAANRSEAAHLATTHP